MSHSLLPYLLLLLTTIYHKWQVLPNLRLYNNISYLILKIFTCHFESHHKSNKPSKILEPLYQPWIPCSIFLFLFCLSHTHYTNRIKTLACNTWAISFNTNFITKFLLINSCKQVNPLIVLSINTPKPTRGLDAFNLPLFGDWWQPD